MSQADYMIQSTTESTISREGAIGLASSGLALAALVIDHLVPGDGQSGDRKRLAIAAVALGALVVAFSVGVYAVLGDSDG